MRWTVDRQKIQKRQIQKEIRCITRGGQTGLWRDAVSLHGRPPANSKSSFQSLSSFYLFSLFFLFADKCKYKRNTSTNTKTNTNTEEASGRLKEEHPISVFILSFLSIFPTRRQTIGLYIQVVVNNMKLHKFSMALMLRGDPSCILLL